MFRTIALTGLMLATALTFSGLAGETTFVDEVAAYCEPVLIEDGSGDQCRNSCSDADKVHQVYRKVTGDEIHCPQ